ncbi:MAG: DUF952 domain-containing protein [Kosmotoga sp.]|nr:MAG: DUF952 domain-containing protein [Kosmotoga sp.]
MKKILHITSIDDWKKAKEIGVYKADTLETEGFIHCSTPEQVIEVANHIFKGRKDLLLLLIDEELLNSPVKYEDPGNGKHYPHIYGPIKISAIIKIEGFKPDRNGFFSLKTIEF